MVLLIKKLAFCEILDIIVNRIYFQKQPDGSGKEIFGVWQSETEYRIDLQHIGIYIPAWR